MGDRHNWQPFGNVSVTPDALDQYYRKYFTRPGNDVWQQYKDRHPDEFSNFAEFSYNTGVLSRFELRFQPNY